MKKSLLPILKILPILLVLVVLSPSASYSQADTLRVMQYNLLNYGNYTSYCTASNNNINNKNAWIRTILTAYYPDILTVCEVGKDYSLPNSFVANNLNINGVTCWRTSAGANSSHSSLTNCIFYNSQKLTLTAHYMAQTYIRDVDVYDFKLNDNDSDDITLTCVIAHLKAGEETTDVDKRKTMAENIMRYLESNYRNKNVLIMGDFNVYNSSEPAYQAFTNSTNYPHSFFIDPLYEYSGVGYWHNNSYFKKYHTQSTHEYSDNTCHSGGGMDDRFDFILMSENIYGGSDGVKYVSNSYNALGQDGRHYNQSINNPVNSAVSRSVADALFNNSDHLPITMELIYAHNIGVDELYDNELSFDIYPNPTKGNINIRFYQENIGKANMMLFNALGQTVYSRDIFVDDGLNEHVIPTENLQKGLYFLKISNADGLIKTIKVIVE